MEKISFIAIMERVLLRGNFVGFRLIGEWDEERVERILTWKKWLMRKLCRRENRFVFIIICVLRDCDQTFH